MLSVVSSIFGEARTGRGEKRNKPVWETESVGELRRMRERVQKASDGDGDGETMNDERQAAWCKAAMADLNLLLAPLH